MTEKPVYRMSGLGDCPRILSAARLGYEPLPEPDYLRRAAREGSRHEEWIVEDLRAEGWIITDQQREVVIEYPTFRLVGHIDGTIAFTGFQAIMGNLHLLEIKALGRFTFDRFAKQGFEAFPHYWAQVQAYGRALQLPDVYYVVKNRDTGERIEQWVEIPESDASSFNFHINRLKAIELAARKGKLYEQEPDGSFKCRTCRFRMLCSRPVAVVEPEQPTAQLVEAAADWWKAHQLQAEAEVLGKGARAVFLATARAQPHFSVDGLRVAYVPASERISYPVVALRKVVAAEVLAQVEKRSLINESVRVTERSE